MKQYLIPLVVSAVVLVSYFVISPTVFQEPNLSKQCSIPYDDNFIEKRGVILGPNDGKPLIPLKKSFQSITLFQ